MLAAGDKVLVWIDGSPFPARVRTPDIIDADDGELCFSYAPASEELRTGVDHSFIAYSDEGLHWARGWSVEARDALIAAQSLAPRSAIKEYVGKFARKAQEEEMVCVVLTSSTPAAGES